MAAVRLALLLAALVALVAPAASAAPRHPLLADAQTFALAIGDGAQAPAAQARLAAHDLVVVDGEATTAAQVRALHRRGVVVLAYVSVGTIESYRSWYRLLRPYRLELWDDWGEWYADVSRRGFRDAIARRVVPRLLAKGVDGLFLDNVDMVATHPAERRGMEALVRRLDRLLGARRVLMAQNGDEAMRRFLPYLDAWNREDVTSTYDFDRRRYVRVPAADHAAALRFLRRIAARGLLVTATDYTARDDAAGVAASVAAACSTPALPYVADIALRRLPAEPFRCP